MSWIETAIQNPNGIISLILIASLNGILTSYMMINDMWKINWCITLSTLLPQVTADKTPYLHVYSIIPVYGYKV